MSLVRIRSVWLSLGFACALHGPAAAATCESLTVLTLAHAQVTKAEAVAAGAFQIEGSGPRVAATNAALRETPAFCRAALTSRPSPDSDIKIEVWLPADAWNGRLQVVGNGAWAGTISYPALANALEQGYAAASTDTGHAGNTVEFAVGHPEKLVDFAYRAVHETAVAAKAVVDAYYARAPEHAYFAGCSTGGRQALAEAQRYAADFDGIVAGAAAYYPSHLQGMQVWTAAITQRAPGAKLGERDLALVNEAALAACDAQDGVADGVIENPQRCEFDAKRLVCDSTNAGACLTPLQAETVDLTYRGPQDGAGRSLFPGLSRGSERGWRTLSGERPLSLAAETYGTLVFDDPSWDYREFDAARDIPIGARRIGPLMDSNDPNLAPFLSRGGKLILYHGWNDPGIPPGSTVEYYEAVKSAVAPALADGGVRLFMVPGMNHCGGGVGTDTFDAVAALDAWVSRGEPPRRIEASRVVDGEVVRTRPLCPFPQEAVYDGSGSTDDTRNFACR
jgi:feruloyl esterase